MLVIVTMHFKPGYLAFR